MLRAIRNAARTSAPRLKTDSQYSSLRQSYPKSLVTIISASGEFPSLWRVIPQHFGALGVGYSGLSLAVVLSLGS